MKSVILIILFSYLCAGTLTCFEEHPLEPGLKEYLALKKSCSDTLFPEPPCCGKSIEDSSRIINGEETGLKELTWNVQIDLIEYDFKLGFGVIGCGGSLINSLWVLTAAHCFINPEEGIYISSTVNVGDWNLEDDPDCIEGFCAPKAVKVETAQFIIHPKYKYEIYWKYDLALVRMKSPVQYSEFVNPICLPLKPLKKKCFENQKAIASGWGETEAGTSSSKKLKTTLKVWEEDKCTNYKTSLDGKIQICASAGSNFTCSGDSGGPLSLKLRNGYYLLGVVSGGNEGCDGTKHPAIFCRVDFKWLVDVILNTTAEPEE